MPRSYCIAAEIAHGVIVASRALSADPIEAAKDPEWIVTRAARAAEQNIMCESSRAAYYALDALMILRPTCDHYAIARGLGFKAEKSATKNLREIRRGHGWWREHTAFLVRKELSSKIGVVPYAPPQSNTGAAALPERRAKDPAIPSAANVDAAVSSRPRVAAPPLKDSGELPRRNLFPRRRVLTAAEEQRNREFFGDPGAPSLRVSMNDRSKGVGE
jgi:hypothetical protein